MSSSRRSPKNVKALHDAALNLNRAVFHYRNLTSMSQGMPQYEYNTTARGDHKLEDGSYRLPKTVAKHPTKKVARSHKKRTIESAVTDALVTLRNAREAFRLAEEKVHG